MLYANGKPVGGGSSGTGGHTIIDENGNSMTARAGLQFVGGANVSDDGTNNKTIVDLASAGGIDGVFVDTSNVIVPRTSYATNFTYTATEDCVAIVDYANNPNASAGISVDNKPYSSIYSSSLNQNTAAVFLKKGQTLTGTNTFSGADVSYIVYGIQTGTTHSKFQPVIYSFEEREIGVWTDGKPLYQITIDCGACPNNTEKSVSIASLNLDIDFVASLETIVYNSTTFLGYKTSDRYINNQISVEYNKPNEEIILSCRDTDQSDLSCIVTIKYTKSTDTAGSGSWTPQGVPAVHYSTDEQVIGTWMGETLYQKTVHTGALSTGEGTKPHNISNFGTLINSTGIAYYSGYTLTFPFISIGQNSWNVGIGGADANDIITEVGSSFTGTSAITDSYITLQYTKSS